MDCSETGFQVGRVILLLNICMVNKKVGNRFLFSRPNHKHERGVAVIAFQPVCSSSHFATWNDHEDDRMKKTVRERRRFYPGKILRLSRTIVHILPLDPLGGPCESGPANRRRPEGEACDVSAQEEGSQLHRGSAGSLQRRGYRFGAGSGGYFGGFLYDGNALSTLIDTNTLVPGGNNGTFSVFAEASLGSDGLAFQGSAPWGRKGSTLRSPKTPAPS